MSGARHNRQIVNFETIPQPVIKICDILPVITLGAIQRRQRQALVIRSTALALLLLTGLFGAYAAGMSAAQINLTAL